MDIDKIYNKDCLEFMRELPNESIDLIATDPPYRVTTKGSCGTMSGYWMEERTRKGKIFTHNDIDIKEYIGEFYRTLKADSHCYICLLYTYHAADHQLSVKLGGRPLT